MLAALLALAVLAEGSEVPRRFPPVDTFQLPACATIEGNEPLEALAEHLYENDPQALLPVARYFATKGEVEYMWGLSFLLMAGVDASLTPEEQGQQAMYWMGNAANCGHEIAQNEYISILEKGLPELRIAAAPELAVCLKGRYGEKDILKSCGIE